MSSGRVRFGIVGLGNMGKHHAKVIVEHATAHTTSPVALGGLCDTMPAAVERAKSEFPGVPTFSSYEHMLDSDQIDAVLIATPHFAHPAMATAAFAAGKHVLCEKPMAVNIAGADAMQAAAKASGKAFGMMFQNRTNPTSVAIRTLMNEGRVGKLLRVTYTRTNWLRTAAYYRSGGWRATWKGEGGGILMNQAPHDLDLLCWFVGQPRKVSAFCRTLRHQIEVEDFAAGIVEFDSGAIGFFQSTTAEAPGRNSLEIVGDEGTILAEGNDVFFTAVYSEVGAGDLHADGKAAESVPTSVVNIIRQSPHSFPKLPPKHTEKIALPTTGGSHIDITVNFAQHVLDGTPMIAPGSDGHYATELSNAFYLSSDSGAPVAVPVDRRAADAFFLQRGSPVG